MPSATSRRPRHLRTAALLAATGMVAAVPWAGPAAAQEEGPVTLRLDDTEGQSSTYSIQSRTHISPPPGMGAETTADATMRMRRSVQSVAGDTLGIAIRIDSFDLDLESDNEQVRSQLRQAEEESRNSVMGETFRASVTRQGEIVEMGVVGEGGPGTQQIDRTLRDLAFATLPEDPISVGESWSATRRADASSFGVPVDGEVVTETTSTLARLFRQNGSQVAEISVEATFGFEADTTAQAAMSVDMSGSSAQTVHFDVDEGRFLGSSGSEDFTVNLTVPGQGSFTVQGTSQSSAELVED